MEAELSVVNSKYKKLNQDYLIIKNNMNQNVDESSLTLIDNFETLIMTKHNQSMNEKSDKNPLIEELRLQLRKLKEQSALDQQDYENKLAIKNQEL